MTLAREAGVRSVSLDLIFGWPGQTRDGWRADLARAIALEPDHLSCYPLTLVHEPEASVPNWPGAGWPTLARWRADAASRQPDDDMSADMYRDAERALGRAGFGHYEIANWARPGHRSRHNLVYWRSGEWLGVGLGAHSHLGGRRFWNDGRLETYLDRYADHPAPAEGRDADAPETAMLALRLREGLAFAELARRHGARAAAEVNERLRSLDGTGLLRLSADRARLTRRGRLLANEVFVRLI
jgi:oxygen-independent coproporphyrinogen-3 oxidase